MSEEFKQRVSLKNSNASVTTYSSDDESEYVKLNFSQKILKIVDSRIYEGFTILITLQSMFSDDLRIAILPKFFDPIYNILVLINILMFIFEITVASIAKKDYFLTFYFFTDIIATLTLVFDFGWLS